MAKRPSESIEDAIKAKPYCSLEYWFPKIVNRVNTPKTVLVPLPENFYDWLEKGPDRKYVEKLQEKAKEVDYPLFMRTDQMSGKHSWSDTCFLEKEENVANQLRWLLEENCMVDMVGEMTPKSICLRQFLHLRSFFTCQAYHGMPVNREFRFFARAGFIECYHPYWPHAAILRGRPNIPNWKDYLPEIESPKNLPFAMVIDASEPFKESWSIDVCEDIDGTWWVTDMALGDRSYHWKHGETTGDDKAWEEAVEFTKELELLDGFNP